jgi:hypothetical protein
MDVLDKKIAMLGCLPVEVVIILADNPLVNTCEAELSPGFKANFLVALARAGPSCQSGYASQHGGDSGPEFSSSGGFDPGTAGLISGLDSPELVHSPWTTTQGSKRKRRGGKDPAQPPKSARGPIKPTTGRTFACPFYLHDRIRHSNCLNFTLKRLVDVRQHLLERAHFQVVHCPNCGITFQGRLVEARQQRDAHIEERTCVSSSTPPNYEGITEDQEQCIRGIARGARSNQFTEVQRWFMIWDFLFPGEPRPDSPFLNDVPEIQRMVDWTSIIFDTDLWLQLPNQPWTTSMDLEQRRAGMSNFMGSIIVLARDLVGQDGSPVEGNHRTDNSSSYRGANTPAPSVATGNSGVNQPPSISIDFVGSPYSSGQAYLNPSPLIGSGQPPAGAHASDQRQQQPRISNPPAVAAPIPLQPAGGPAVVAPQDLHVQQPAPPPEEAAGTEHDPTLPSLAAGELMNFIAMDLDLSWLGSVYATEDGHHEPAGEDKPGRHQQGQ